MKPPGKFEKLFNQNSNWKTFGFNPDLTDATEIENAIVKIEPEFNLVMITEYIDESLILMKHELDLDLEDISSFAKNVVANHTKTVPEGLRQKVYQWQNLDTVLYNYFNKTLWQKIDKFGAERMKKEVHELKQFNQKF